jgi:hypothetical protein
MVHCLVKKLGADVNQPNGESCTPLYIAPAQDDLAMVQCLVKELCGNVNQANYKDNTPMYIAAKEGHLAMVRILVKELGANINQAAQNGSTPLIVATYEKHADIVRWLVKAGANTQACATLIGSEFTASTLSSIVGASAEQTAYLKAKTHCSNPGCSGVGLVKCTGCKQARYCREACQLAHWMGRLQALERGAGGRDGASKQVMERYILWLNNGGNQNSINLRCLVMSGRLRYSVPPSE